MGTIDNGDRPLGPVAIIVAAAGRGERLGGSRPKALEVVGGAVLLTHVLEQLTQVPDAQQIVVAAPPGCDKEVTDLCGAWPQLATTVVAGGIRREDSVLAALSIIPEQVEIVLVHDAARAFAPASLFREVIAAVHQHGIAVVPGLPVTDTVKAVDEAEEVVGTIDRSRLRVIQTPQGFPRQVLVAAHEAAAGVGATDDAGLVERIGGRVHVIPGHPTAFKVTRPFDISVAEALLRARARQERDTP